MLRIQTTTIEKVVIIGSDDELSMAYEYFSMMGIHQTDLSHFESPSRGGTQFRLSGEREIFPCESEEERILREIENAAQQVIAADEPPTGKEA